MAWLYFFGAGGQSTNETPTSSSPPVPDHCDGVGQGTPSLHSWWAWPTQLRNRTAPSAWFGSVGVRPTTGGTNNRAVNPVRFRTPTDPPPRAPTNGRLGFPFGSLGAGGRLPKARRGRFFQKFNSSSSSSSSSQAGGKKPAVLLSGLKKIMHAPRAFTSERAWPDEKPCQSSTVRLFSFCSLPKKVAQFATSAFTEIASFVLYSAL